MEATLIQDKDEPNAYRVEAIDADGGCEVAMFSGPRALDRAVALAVAFYKKLNDPQRLVGC